MKKTTCLRLFGLLLILGLQACSSQPVDSAVDTVTAVLVEPVTPANPSASNAVKEQAPSLQTKFQTHKEAPPLAVLLSADIPAYSDVAEALQYQSDIPLKFFTLGSVEDNKKILLMIQEGNFEKLVVIGPAAASASKVLKGKVVVFCQVMDYRDLALPDEGVYGVSMIPSAKQLFKTWRELSPSLRRVAIMTGPGHTEDMAAVSAHAASYGITIIHRQVNNDKEMLYVGKSLMDDVDGFWLLPDSRILSRGSLKEFMSYSIKLSKQLAVFNEQLLMFGGLLVVEPSVNDVARQIKKQLSNRDLIVAALQEAEIAINQKVLQKLNLEPSKPNSLAEK